MPARILKESGDSANVQLQNGQKKTVKRSAKEPLWPLNHSSLSRIEDDLVMVDAINQVKKDHDGQERVMYMYVYMLGVYLNYRGGRAGSAYWCDETSGDCFHTQVPQGFTLNHGTLVVHICIDVRGNGVCMLSSVLRPPSSVLSRMRGHWSDKNGMQNMFIILIAKMFMIVCTIEDYSEPLHLNYIRFGLIGQVSVAGVNLRMRISVGEMEGRSSLSPSPPLPPTPFVALYPPLPALWP